MYPRLLVKWLVLFPREASVRDSLHVQRMVAAELEAVPVCSQPYDAQTKELGAEVNQRHVV